MGLAFVLVIWLFIGAVLSAAGSIVFGISTAFFTRGVLSGRRLAITYAVSFPFLCTGWVGAVFVFHGIVSETLFDRDFGLGDTWHAPLPNGYHVTMIDVTDYGYISSTQTTSKGAIVEEDVFGVRTLQVTGTYILGGVDSHASEHWEKGIDHVDNYFLLDTTKGNKTVFPDYDALRRAAQQVGVEPNLEPIYSVYSRFRFTWFGVFSGILLVLPPLIGFSMLVWLILRLRRQRGVPPVGHSAEIFDR